MKTHTIVSPPEKVGQELERAYSIYRESLPMAELIYVPMEKTDTLAEVSWHPARDHLLPLILKVLEANHADGLFHINNIGVLTQKTDSAQGAGMVEAEKFFLEREYNYHWYVHSDVIPPPDALSRLKAHKKDIVTCLMPKLSGSSSYLHYYDSGLAPWETRAGVPGMYLYDLCEPIHPNSNPARKVIEPGMGLVEIAAPGFGCTLRPREVVEKAGVHTLPFDDWVDHWIDNYYGYYLTAQTPYRMWVDTDIRCYHVCPPLKGKRLYDPDNFKLSGVHPNVLFGPDFYGWTVEEQYGISLAKLNERAEV